MMRAARQAGDRIAFVAGPVVVHTGGGAYFCDLIRVRLRRRPARGNALAVTNAEQALYGTRSACDMESGRAISRAATGTTCAHQRHLPRRRPASGGRQRRPENQA